MEKPEKEIPAVMRALASYANSDIQEQVIRTYYSADAVLHHPYLGVKGVDDMVAIYQLAGLYYNYKEMEILDVFYDPAKNKSVVHTRVHIWPLWLLNKPRPVDMVVRLDLENFTSGDGRVLKRIKVQQDYFFLSTFVAVIPLLGDIYSMEWLRFTAGHAFARSFAFLRMLALAVLPKGVQQLIGI